MPIGIQGCAADNKSVRGEEIEGVGSERHPAVAIGPREGTADAIGSRKDRFHRGRIHGAAEIYDNIIPGRESCITLRRDAGGQIGRHSGYQIGIGEGEKCVYQRYHDRVAVIVLRGKYQFQRIAGQAFNKVETVVQLAGIVGELVKQRLKGIGGVAQPPSSSHGAVNGNGALFVLDDTC